VPQLPQLVLSTRVLAHVPLQAVKPAEQLQLDALQI
jgi:hypothetical protein